MVITLDGGHYKILSGNPPFSLAEWPSSPEGGSIFVASVFWLAEWSWRRRVAIFSNVLNSFVILEINL